jgi:ubiquinone/menaquinone biosynthesis C-methylase UbiE
MKREQAVEHEMKDFWDAKAQENAPFYIATWRGYERRDTEDFFLSAAEATKFVQSSGYQPTGHDRMLEIGCGVGRMTHGFAQLFGEVHAIDVSGEMIRQAKTHLAHLPNVHLYETSGADLAPFADSSLDFCFSFIVFQHIPSKAVIFTYIREVGRVLKPGGVFHFQVNGLPDPDATVTPPVLAVKRVYRRWVRRPALASWRWLRRGPRGFEAPAWLGVSLSADEVKAECTAAGLVVRDVSGAGTAYMWITATKPQERNTNGVGTQSSQTAS